MGSGTPAWRLLGLAPSSRARGQGPFECRHTVATCLSVQEDVNGARQITNKVTTSLGPLISAVVASAPEIWTKGGRMGVLQAIFLYCGNRWDPFCLVSATTEVCLQSIPPFLY